MADGGSTISGLPTAPALDGSELIPVVIQGVVTSISSAVNAVITISNPSSLNPFIAGQKVSFNSILGMTQLNAQSAVVSATGGVSGAWTITVPIDTTGYGAYVSGGFVEGNAKILLNSTRRNADASPYNPTFLSGGILYNGPNGVVAADNNMIFGKSIPNPSGINGPCLLLGSGGGGGNNVAFWVITDQAFDTASPGNDIGMTAGEVQPGSSQRAGNLSFYGGGADLGVGGNLLLQGGTSARGAPGLTLLQGANNTDQSHPAGDVFMIAGQVGSVGANYHLIMTLTNGVPGVGRKRVNSTIIQDDYSDGRIYSYPSNGFGDPGAPWISRGPTAGQPAGWAGSSEVATGTITYAKPGGGSGTITVVSGLITNIT